jgi:hypothetical protein
MHHENLTLHQRNSLLDTITITGCRPDHVMDNRPLTA